MNVILVLIFIITIRIQDSFSAPKTLPVRNLGVLCRGKLKHSSLARVENLDQDERCDICGQDFFSGEQSVSCADCRKKMHAVCCNVDLLTFCAKRPELKVFGSERELMKRYSCGYEMSNSNTNEIVSHHWDKCNFSVTKRKCDICKKKLGFNPKEEKAVHCCRCKIKLDKKCENVFIHFIYPRRELIMKSSVNLEKLTFENGHLEECRKVIEQYKNQYELVVKCCKRVVNKMQEQSQEIHDLMGKISKAVPNLNTINEDMFDMTKGDSNQNMADRVCGPHMVPPIAVGSPYYPESFRSGLSTTSRAHNLSANVSPEMRGILFFFYDSIN